MNIKFFFLNNAILRFIYKIQKILKNKSSKKHYAEFGEDIFINRIFNKKAKGFYVDIGSYHPYKGSLTYLLYKKGWTGMNIDLSPLSIELFKISRPNDININCAIGAINGQVCYFQNSEINQQNSLKKKSSKQIKKKISCHTLSEIFKKNKIKKIDFLNIDTEGNELDVLKHIDFKKVYINLISVECNSFSKNNIKKNKIIDFLFHQNFELINIIGVTMIFIKKNKINKIMKTIEIG